MPENTLTSRLLQPEDLESWNTFVDGSPWSDILQFWQWGEVKKTEGWNPIRLAVYSGDRMVIGAQALIKKAPLLGNYLYVPHGPVFQTIEDLQLGLFPLLQHLKQLAREQNCFAIEIEPKIGVCLEPEKLSKNLEHFVDSALLPVFKEHGFRETGRNMQPKYKLLYDLELGDEALLKMMKKNTRYNVRLAEKKGVVVKEYFPEDPAINQKIDVFYALLLETQKRAHGYPIRPKSSFQRLFQEFDATAHLSLFETSFNSEVIGINISERTNWWSSSFYAASNRLYPETKAMYLLRWESIKSAKAFGSKVYDFWGIIPDDKQHKGYSDTKMSFGGVRIDHVGILSLPTKPFAYFVWDKIVPMRSKLSAFLRNLHSRPQES